MSRPGSTSTIPDHLREVAARHADELAVVDGRDRITYAELIDRIDTTRAWLDDTLHVEPGDVVAASLRNGWPFVASLFAVSELGGIFVPCNPRWRAPELRWLAARLGLRRVITEGAFRGEWDPLELPTQRIVTVEEAPGASAAGASRTPSSHSRSADDPAVYLVTSGSTGVPKIVPRSHRNLCAGAENVGRAYGMQPGRRMLGVAPFVQANGLNNGLLLPLLNGASLVLLREFAPKTCTALIHRERVDVMTASPFVYGMLADRVTDASRLSSLSLCASSGARIPTAVTRRWTERFGVRVREHYGMTETGAIAFDSLESAPPGETGGAFVGRPIPGVEVKIVSGSDYGEGPLATGEIAVRSLAVMSGYVGEPEWTARSFRDGFFLTGDLGYVGEDGGVRLVGRIGRTINLAGTKIDPAELEQALLTMPGITGCHVDAIEAERGVALVRARIVASRLVTRADVIRHCRQRLAEYKLPRVIEFLDGSALTADSKIQAARQPEQLPR